MYARQDSVLNLSSLLNNSFNSNEVVGKGLLTPLVDFSSEATFEEPLSWEITVRNTGGEDNFILTGKVEGKVIMSCRRCLEPVKVTSYSELIYKMVYSPNVNRLELIEIEKDEEYLVFGKPETDFSEFLMQAFVVDLPITALCKEDCPGIIVEGLETKNLAPSNSSPFAVLKDLQIN